MFGIFKGLKEAWTIERAKMKAEGNLPALSEAIRSYELGTYWRLSRNYEKRYQGQEDFCYSLAYTVVYYLFLHEKGMKEMESFYKTNKRLVDEEIQRSLRDEQIKTAFSMACGAKIILYAILTGNPRNPFSEEMDKISTRATDLDIEITNVVRLWGPKAMVNLHQHAKDYMNSPEIGGFEVMSDTIIKCQRCGTNNRIRPHDPNLRPVCSKCKNHLVEVR
jgi:hypothetical protein